MTPAIDSVEETLPYPELLEAMEAYNESIFADKQDGLCDPWSYQAPVFDLAEYGIEDGIVGILSIPKMDLELPIYLGATAEHLAGGRPNCLKPVCPLAARIPTASWPGTGGGTALFSFGILNCWKLGTKL